MVAPRFVSHRQQIEPDYDTKGFLTINAALRGYFGNSGDMAVPGRTEQRHRR